MGLNISSFNTNIAEFTQYFTFGCSRCHGINFESFFLQMLKSASNDSFTADKRLGTYKRPHINTLCTHADTKKTEARAQTGAERHQQLQNTDARAFFGCLTPYLTPDAPHFTQQSSSQSACTQHTHRPPDEPHICATSCNSAYLTYNSAPWTNTFKGSRAPANNGTHPYRHQRIHPK